MAGSITDFRQKVAEVREFLPDCNLSPRLRDFITEVINHAVSLDDRTTERLTQLVNALEQDQTIAESSRVFLLMITERHDIEDAAGRMQIRTLLGSALIGKPPEAPRRPGRAVRTLPDGREVVAPDLSGM